MTNLKFIGEVTSVERRPGFREDCLGITIKALHKSASVTFEVPLYRAQSYPIGRRVEFTVRAGVPRR